MMDSEWTNISADPEVSALIVQALTDNIDPITYLGEHGYNMTNSFVSICQEWVEMISKMISGTPFTNIHVSCTPFTGNQWNGVRSPDLGRAARALIAADAPRRHREPVFDTAEDTRADKETELQYEQMRRQSSGLYEEGSDAGRIGGEHSDQDLQEGRGEVRLSSSAKSGSETSEEVVNAGAIHGDREEAVDEVRPRWEKGRQDWPGEHRHIRPTSVLKIHCDNPVVQVVAVGSDLAVRTCQTWLDSQSPLFRARFFSRRERKVVLPWLPKLHELAWGVHEQPIRDLRQLVLASFFFYVYDCPAIARNLIERADALKGVQEETATLTTRDLVHALEEVHNMDEVRARVRSSERTSGEFRTWLTNLPDI
jgi:hypothetical protein